MSVPLKRMSMVPRAGGPVGRPRTRTRTYNPDTLAPPAEPTAQLVLFESADAEIMGGNSTRVPLDAILPEPREGADQLRGQTPQLASRSQRKFRLQPASVAGEVDHARRAIVPAGMKSKAAPIVGEMGHVRLLLDQPAGERAGVRATDRGGLQPKRAVDVLAQPRDPHRMVDQNRGVEDDGGRAVCVQRNLTLHREFHGRSGPPPPPTSAARSTLPNIKTFVRARKPRIDKGFNRNKNGAAVGRCVAPKKRKNTGGAGAPQSARRRGNEPKPRGHGRERRE